MKLLLDQGLPRTAAERLRERGIDAVHAARSAWPPRKTRKILAFASQSETLDADFHALLV